MLPSPAIPRRTLFILLIKHRLAPFFNSIALMLCAAVQESRMAPLPPALLRVTVDGKFFRLGEKKFFPKGVTYGPFAPSEQHGTFASPEQTALDFALIRELNGNVLRIYHVPPRWFLDLALEHDLRVMIDIPWQKHTCFLDSET